MPDVDEIHSIALAASIPVDRRFVDADTAAAMLSYSTAHFVRRIACRQDFPRARDFGGNPRWLLSDVFDWASSQPVRDLRRRRVVVDAE